MKKILLVVIVFGMLFSYNLCFGDLYKCIDEDGQTHLSNIPSNPKCHYVLIMEERPNTPQSVFGERLKDWVEYGRSKYGDYLLYNKKNIMKSGKKNIVNVWDIHIFSGEGRMDLYYRKKRKGVSTYGWDILSHSIVLTQIDCNNKKSKILSIIEYDKEGKTLFQSSYDDEQKWEYIVPVSIEETLRKKVCR